MRTETMVQGGWRKWWLQGALAWIAILALRTVAVAEPVTTNRLHLVTPSLVMWEVADTLSGTHTNPYPSWVSGDGTTLLLPAASTFDLRLNGTPVTVSDVTLTRQASHAELSVYRVDVITRVFLRLTSPIAETGLLTASHAEIGSGRTTLTPQRESQAILVNRVGYLPGGPKRGFVYLALGEWSELTIDNGLPFSVVDTATGAAVYSGTLAKRSDVGFNTTPLPYQNVWEANFSGFTSSGQYRLSIPGLGTSAVFRIDDGTAGQAARSAALGLYHQRSGVALTLPYTRHTRAAGHLAPAEIPGPTHPTNPLLAQSSADYSAMPRHTAPQLANVANSLYPFVRQGTVDTSGGHHDAGDYSKYTINSAQLVHEVAFAAENFPGAGALDNLGLPESGDGIGDLWQVAKREADFLAKLQDLDGGFYFLVYPRARRYEQNVMPAQGDPQVVWPKNTAATAAACGALAQLGGAPAFRARYPEDAARYLAAATNAWAFLESAVSRFGRDGAYQKLTHYGNDFLHDDEMAYAAAALFTATGESRFETALQSWMPDPASRDIRRWSWWRLFACWGNAIRTYTFADGRPGAASRNPSYLAACRNEVLLSGNDQALRAEQSALGVSFPNESKRIYSAGWFFPEAAAFDLMAAMVQSTDPAQRERYQNAIWSNLGYAWGANPSALTYVTGLGDNSPIEPVSQIANNDREELPPSGTPVGGPTSGFSWLDRYQRTLSTVMYPPPNRDTGRFPLYDRFTDVFNVNTEATIVEMGQALAVGAGLLGTSPLAGLNNATPATLQIVGLPEPLPLGSTANMTLAAAGEDLSAARVTWETPQGWFVGGTSYSLTRTNARALWLEVEAVLPDGRRLFGSREIPTVNRAPTARPKTAALTLPTPASSALIGAIVEDDGLPAPLNLRWAQQSGPLPVDFTDPFSADTHVAFAKAGTYVLELTVDDSEYSVSTSVTVTVNGSAPQGLDGVADPSTLKLEGFTPGSVVTGTMAGRAQLAYGAQFWSVPPEGVVLRTRAVGDTLSYIIPDFLSASDSRPFTLETYVLIRGYRGWSVASVPILSINQAWDARIEIIDDKWSTGHRPFARVGQTTLISSTQWDGMIPTNRWVRLAVGFDPANSLAAVWLDGQLIAQGAASINTSRTTPWTLLAGNADADFDDLRLHRGFGPWVHPEMLQADTSTLSLFPFDYSLAPTVGPWSVQAIGNAAYSPDPAWMRWPTGAAVELAGYGSYLTAQFPDATLQPDAGQPLALEARFRIDRYDAYGKNNAPLIALQQGYDAQLLVEQTKWSTTPSVRLGNTVVLSPTTWGSMVTTGAWHHLAMQWNGRDRSDIWIDGVRRAESTVPQNSRRTGDWFLTLGNFVGAVDELRVSRTLRWQESPQPVVVPSVPALTGDAWATPSGTVIAWAPLDGNLTDPSRGGAALTSEGTLTFADLTGSPHKVLQVPWIGSHVYEELPDSAVGIQSIRLSAWIMPEAWAAYGVVTTPILSFSQAWDARLELIQDKWGTSPDVIVGTTAVVPRASVGSALALGQWHHIEIYAQPQPDQTHAMASVYVDGVLLGTSEVPFTWLRSTTWRLDVGNFRGSVAGVSVSTAAAFF